MALCYCTSCWVQSEAISERASAAAGSVKLQKQKKAVHAA